MGAFLRRTLILASSSPRRLSLLKLVGLNPVVVGPDVEEVREGAAPEVLVTLNALAKANVVSNYLGVPRDAVIVAADTLVTVGDLVLGKARSRDEVREFLKLLSGRWHRVVTGVAIKDLERELTEAFFVNTWVRFRDLSNEEIEYYVATGEGVGKAGGYAIQGMGAGLIAEVRGDPYNVAGLPISRVCEVLKDLGIYCFIPSKTS